MKAIIYKDELGKDIEVVEIPAELRRAAAAAREQLLDEVSHYDDELVELILEEAEIPAEPPRAPRSARRRSTIKLTPVLCGSSFKNKGVQPLLDAVIDYLPSPLDVPPVEGLEPVKGGEDRAGRRARPTTTSRSRRSRSRSWPTPTSASSPTSASTPARSRPARACSTSRTGQHRARSAAS